MALKEKGPAGEALYPAAEAARLAGLRPSRVRRWLKGYQYTYGSAIHRQRPVLPHPDQPEAQYASFLDLVDLLFVRRFLEYGVSLQRLRLALQEATDILQTEHFARRNFFTDGRGIFLELNEQGDAILELLKGGQWVIAPIIRQLAHQIEFDATTEVATKWYPLGPKGLVVVDPCISFGRPTLVSRGIATATVYDLYQAEHEDLTGVCSWLDITRAQAEAAVEFEAKLAA